jgi:hypothetical protein
MARTLAVLDRLESMILSQIPSVKTARPPEAGKADTEQ